MIQRENTDRTMPILHLINIAHMFLKLELSYLKWAPQKV